MRSRLEIAQQHVLQARRIVDRQRQLVTSLRAHGCDYQGAERTLDLFERSLEIFEEHFAEIAEV